jgi:hypothetical protein
MTQQQRVQLLYAAFGNVFVESARINFEKKWCIVYRYPADIAQAIPSLGASVYMNKVLVPIYEKFLRLLIARNLHTEINTNDQCFMVRLVRGASSPSMHSWAIAFDLNPAHNPLGVTREQAIAQGLTPFTVEFQKAAKDSGLICGYDFTRCDGMHFELDLREVQKLVPNHKLIPTPKPSSPQN